MILAVRACVAEKFAKQYAKHLLTTNIFGFYLAENRHTRDTEACQHINTHTSNKAHLLLCTSYKTTLKYIYIFYISFSLQSPFFSLLATPLFHIIVDKHSFVLYYSFSYFRLFSLSVNRLMFCLPIEVHHVDRFQANWFEMHNTVVISNCYQESLKDSRIKFTCKIHYERSAHESLIWCYSAYNNRKTVLSRKLQRTCVCVCICILSMTQFNAH